MPNFLEKDTGTIYTAAALIPKGLPVDNLSVMRKAGFYPIEYQHQLTVDPWTQKEEPMPLDFNETDQTYYQRYKTVSLDRDTLARNLQILKSRAIDCLNHQTSQEILAGFYYDASSIADSDTFDREEQPVFISYNELDQINFINTSYQFSSKQIETASWKSYGDRSKEDLIPLTLSEQEFYDLYNQALAFKDRLLAAGEAKKAEIRSVNTIAELRLYCANNNIELLATQEDAQSV